MQSPPKTRPRRNTKASPHEGQQESDNAAHSTADQSEDPRGSPPAQPPSPGPGDDPLHAQNAPAAESYRTRQKPGSRTRASTDAKKESKAAKKKLAPTSNVPLLDRVDEDIDMDSAGTSTRPNRRAFGRQLAVPPK